MRHITPDHLHAFFHKLTPTDARHTAHSSQAPERRYVTVDGLPAQEVKILSLGRSCDNMDASCLRA